MVNSAQLHPDHLIGVRGKLARQGAAVDRDATAGLGNHGVLVIEAVDGAQIGMGQHLMVDHPAGAEPLEVDAEVERLAGVAVDGKKLDLAVSKIRDFRRELDMREGRLTRSFIWSEEDGKETSLVFTRFLSMAENNIACINIMLQLKCRDACFFFPVDYCPVDRSCSTVPGQQRSMHVDGAHWRHVPYYFRQHPECYHDLQVGMKGF